MTFIPRLTLKLTYNHHRIPFEDAVVKHNLRGNLNYLSTWKGIIKVKLTGKLFVCSGTPRVVFDSTSVNILSMEHENFKYNLFIKDPCFFVPTLTSNAGQNVNGSFGLFCNRGCG